MAVTWILLQPMNTREYVCEVLKAVFVRSSPTLYRLPGCTHCLLLLPRAHPVPLISIFWTPSLNGTKTRAHHIQTQAFRTFMLTIPWRLQGHSKSQSYSIMQTAHSTGFAVCNTTDKKEADAQSAELGNANLMSSVVEAN